MRVAYLVDYFPPNHDGGDSVFARELGITLQDDVDLSVFTRLPLRQETSRSVDHGLMINHLGEDWERVLENQRPFDLIHFFQIDNLPMVHALQRNSSAQTLFHMEISFLRYAEMNEPDYDADRYHRLEREAVTLADRIIIPSEREAREIRRIFPDADLVVIPNGLDSGRFAQPRLPSYDNIWNYCFMGRIDDPMKGGDALIDAIGSLNPRVLDSMHFRFIGCRDDWFTSRLERLGTMPSYTLHPWITDPSVLQEALQGTHYMVMPSRYETFGMVCLEGMLQGIVPIVSDAGAMGDMIRDGAGIPIAEVMPASIAASLVASTRLNTTAHQEMRWCAIRRAAEYDIRNIAIRVNELYETAVK